MNTSESSSRLPIAPAPKNSIPRFALRNCLLAISAGVIIGLGARRSHQTNAAPSRIAPCIRLSQSARSPPNGFASTSATVRNRTAAPSSTIPRTSTWRPALRSHVSGHQRRQSTTPSTPKGMLIRKIQCQLATSTSTPPSTGPSAEDTSATTAISARPRPRCSGGNTSTVIAKPSGARMPAPTPWIARNTISHSTDHAVAHSAEPIVKTVRPMMKKRLRPNWSASRPIETSRIANVML